MCGNGLRCVGYLLSFLQNRKEIIVYIDKTKYLLKKDVNENIIVKVSSIIKKDNFIYLGNKHLVLYGQHFTNNHKLISKKKKCNVHLINYISRNKFKIKTYEYGVGHTTCCGSGILAAFYYLLMENKVNNEVSVITDGGIVYCYYKANEFYLKGKVNLVSKGEYYGI